MQVKTSLSDYSKDISYLKQLLLRNVLSPGKTTNMARNEVTAALTKAKASYFERMLGKVKKSSATSRIVHKKSIGPLRRNDGGLALIDKEKHS